MSDRDDLHDILFKIFPSEDTYTRLDYAVDAIIAAGWVRCLHKNASGFSNNGGPWHRSCSDCKKRWVEA